MKQKIASIHQHTFRVSKDPGTRIIHQVLKTEILQGDFILVCVWCLYNTLFGFGTRKVSWD